MVTTTDRTLAAATDAAKVLGEDWLRRVFDALQHSATHADDVSEAWPHVICAIAPVPTTDPTAYGPTPLAAAVRRTLSGLRIDRARRGQYVTATDPADMVEHTVSTFGPQRPLWEDVAPTLPIGLGDVLQRVAESRLTSDAARDRIDAMCAASPSLNVSTVCEALGWERAKDGTYSARQRRDARNIIVAAWALASVRMMTAHKGETVEERAARALAWILRNKGSKRESLAVPFVDGRDPFATGPVQSLGFRPQRLAKTGSARRDAPVKTSSGVGTTFVWVPTTPCDAPKDGRSGVVCGCGGKRGPLLADGAGVLSHRAKEWTLLTFGTGETALPPRQTSEAAKAKAASAVEDAAAAASAAYDAVRAVWDPTTATTHRVEEERVPDSPSAAYALLYSPGKPCPSPAPEGLAMCRCGAKRGALVPDDAGTLCHRARTSGH